MESSRLGLSFAAQPAALTIAVNLTVFAKVPFLSASNRMRSHIPFLDAPTIIAASAVFFLRGKLRGHPRFDVTLC